MHNCHRDSVLDLDALVAAGHGLKPLLSLPMPMMSGRRSGPRASLHGRQEVECLGSDWSILAVCRSGVRPSIDRPITEE